MTDAQSEVFSGPLGEQLLHRLERAIAQARELLGLPLPTAGEQRDPRAELAELTERLGEVARGGTGTLHEGQVAALERLREEHLVALERLHQRFDARFDALSRVQSAVAELREITSPAGMLARAPAALCEHSALERAIVSLVRGGRMVAESAHFEADAEGARAVLDQLRAEPLRLEHPLIETELLRRRRATIVVDAQVHPRADRRLAQLMGWRSYAVAPLVVGTRVVGVIHADRGPGRPLDVLDRDVLWEFASGLAQAYESASLRRTLRGEREQMRQFLEWLGARSGQLADAPVRLATGTRMPIAPPEALDHPVPPEGRDDRVVFEGLLTRRELDVLRLLADGHTNKAIADALVISGGTVKFHVNSILRKLHAANRAEAVSRYLRLLGMRTP
jgi:LuxR family transcriptional regulator, regulator of acetate metabolism